MAEETVAPAAEAPAPAEVAPATEPAVDTNIAVSTDTPAPAAPAAEESSERTSIMNQEPEAPAPVAPDAYEFKAPEGVEFDATTIDSFSKLAKEDNLSQDAASRYVELLQDHNKRAAADALAEQNKVLDGWEAEVKALPNYQSTVLLAKKAEHFMNDAMKELVSGPLGSNPAFIQFAARIGGLHSEDSVVTSGGAQQDLPQSLGASLYPDMASN